MKFDCGLTLEERRKARGNALSKKIEREGNGEKFFTLIPRRIGHRDCRWLENIKRTLVLIKIEDSWGNTRSFTPKEAISTFSFRDFVRSGGTPKFVYEYTALEAGDESI